MKEVIKQFLLTVKNYNSFMEVLEEKKRSFGNVELFPSEIHTLVYINEHQTDNFTEISKGLGITKGALTKTIAKLERKKLISKYYKANNQKNIYFNLTKIGQKSYLAHQAFHNKFKIDVPEEAVDYFTCNKQVLVKALMYANQVIEQLKEVVEQYD